MKTNNLTDDQIRNIKNLEVQQYAYAYDFHAENINSLEEKIKELQNEYLNRRRCLQSEAEELTRSLKDRVKAKFYAKRNYLQKEWNKSISLTFEKFKIVSITERGIIFSVRYSSRFESGRQCLVELTHEQSAMTDNHFRDFIKDYGKFLDELTNNKRKARQNS